MANPHSNHRVLYVDDHADTLEMVTLMLEAGGFEVSSCSNFKDGLEAASDEKFDLYPLDLRLRVSQNLSCRYADS